MIFKESSGDEEFILHSRKRKFKPSQSENAPIARRSLRLQNKYFHYGSETSIDSINSNLQEKHKIELSTEIIVKILHFCSAPTILSFSATSRKNNLISRMQIIWKNRCRVDFDLRSKWIDHNYLEMYIMFFKAKIISKWGDMFRPTSQLKLSIVTWYLTVSRPPHESVAILTVQQVQKIWGITEDDIINYKKHRNMTFNICCLFPFSWRSAYELALHKFGSIEALQKYVLNKCYRNREILNEYYKLYNLTTKDSKFTDLNGNPIRFLLKNVPKGNPCFLSTFYTMAQNFQNWIIEKNQTALSRRPISEIIRDYIYALDYTIRQRKKEKNKFPSGIPIEQLETWAHSYTERLFEMGTWTEQNHIPRVSNFSKADSTKSQTLMNQYMDSGDDKHLESLRTFYSRIKKIYFYVQKYGLIKHYTSSACQNSPCRHFKLIRLTANKFSNSGREEDFVKFKETIELYLTTNLTKHRKFPHMIPPRMNNCSSSCMSRSISRERSDYMHDGIPYPYIQLTQCNINPIHVAMNPFEYENLAFGVNPLVRSNILNSWHQIQQHHFYTNLGHM